MRLCRVKAVGSPPKPGVAVGIWEAVWWGWADGSGSFPTSEIL